MISFENMEVEVSAGLLIGLGALTAFLLTWFSIPTIVRVANAKGLYDKPTARSSHKINTPTLGGVAIFIGFTVAAALFAGISRSRELLFVLTGLIVLFFTGIKDDILVIDPVKKLLGQIVAATVVVLFGDVRLTGFYGFLGIGEISYAMSLLLSVFVFLVIINGFNLIDGIDGLAAGIGVLTAAVFGVWFIFVGNDFAAVLCFSLVGSLLAFLWFNLFGKKNKIFLGDCGSLILGLMLSVFTVKFLEANLITAGALHVFAAPVVAFSVLIIPLFDTLRIVVLRVVKGRSIFEAGRYHLHHKLVDIGLSHLQTTLILLAVNAFFILLAYLLQNTVDIFLLIIILVLAIVLAEIPAVMINHRERQALG